MATSLTGVPALKDALVKAMSYLPQDTDFGILVYGPDGKHFGMFEDMEQAADFIAWRETPEPDPPELLRKR